MTDKRNSPFSRWLVENRKARKMTQDDLSEASGIDQGVISKYERGVLLPPKRGSVMDLATGLFGSSYISDPAAIRAVNEGLKLLEFAAIETSEDEVAYPLHPREIVRTLIREKRFDDQQFSGEEIEQIATGVASLIGGYIADKREARGEIN